MLKYLWAVLIQVVAQSKLEVLLVNGPDACLDDAAIVGLKPKPGSHQESIGTNTPPTVHGHRFSHKKGHAALQSPNRKVVCHLWTHPDINSCYLGISV